MTKKIPGEKKSVKEEKVNKSSEEIKKVEAKAPGKTEIKKKKEPENQVVKDLMVTDSFKPIRGKKKAIPTLRYFSSIPMHRPKSDDIQIWQGSRACALAALKAGVDFYGGYPITPSTEIAEILSEELPKRGGKFIQMEDEIGSIAAILGASLAGAKVMTATSGPGFSLMQEALGFGMLNEIPSVIVNVMRGGPSTGLPTRPSQGDVMQARWGTHGDHEAIALVPSSVEECYTLTLKAFNMAEYLRHPVILLMDEVIAHMREPISPSHCLDSMAEGILNRDKPHMPPDWYSPFKAGARFVPKMAAIGEGYRFHVTGLIHDESGFPTLVEKEIHGLLTRLKRKIVDNRDKVVMTEAYMTDDADDILFAYGSTARVAMEVVHTMRKKGKKVGLFKPLTIWPFPTIELIHAVKKSQRIFVCEMNMGQLVDMVASTVGASLEVRQVNRYDGDLLSPSEIIEALEAGKAQ